MAEAVSLANELNEMRALAIALWHAGILAHFEGDPAEVERLASELIELSTRLNFEPFLQRAAVLHGWARSASGNTAEGISWIEDGIGDCRATASILDMPFLLALKAEALHLADRTVESLEAIREADALVERFENRYWSAELHRLRGVFLAAIAADEAQVEDSFQAAIRVAREHKSISQEKRAQATYTEYRRQKARGQKDVDSDYLCGDCFQRRTYGSRVSVGVPARENQTPSRRRESFAPATLRFHRHRLTPQQNPETLSLWSLRHPISLIVPRKGSAPAPRAVRLDDVLPRNVRMGLFVFMQRVLLLC